MLDACSQLLDLLDALTRASDVESALSAGVDMVADRFDASLVSIVSNDHVVVSTTTDHVIEQQVLTALAQGEGGTVAMSGPAPTYALVAKLTASPDALVIVRAEPFRPDEVEASRVIARLFAMALPLLTQANENELLRSNQQANEQLFDSLLWVQLLTTNRGHIDLLLQTITSETASLLNADLVGIFSEESETIIHRSRSPELPAATWSTDAGAERSLRELGRRAMTGDLGEPEQVCIGADPATSADVTAIGAALVEEGRTVGSLFALTTTAPSDAPFNQHTAVRTFANQTSMALADARKGAELQDAFRDTLTGLPDRALFHDRFEHAVAVGNRRATTTALLCIDLDHFKALNDAFGQEAGNTVLRDVADRLSGFGRTSDSVARIGGDEFAILLEDASAAEAAAVAHRLVAEISEVPNEASPTGTCGASIGIAVSDPMQATTDELLRCADIAMHVAKSGGRGDVVIYNPTMGSSRLDQKRLAGDLAVALDNNEFVVHYQPIVSLLNRHIVGAEALVRWQQADGTMVSPTDFIQAAEDTGMIVPIGRQVMQVACAQAATWRREHGAAADLRLSVNISGRQLESDEIRNDVRSSLESGLLDPSALTLEVTESIFVDDAAAAGNRLRALKELGVKLAIDDFGTGFSSLSYIHRHPFDVLKIDRSFVSGLGSTSSSGALVKTLLALGQQLSLTTVAEGIETPSELAQLRALRCRYGQGFLFHRPVDASTFGQLLEEQSATVGADG